MDELLGEVKNGLFLSRKTGNGKKQRKRGVINGFQIGFWKKFKLLKQWLRLKLEPLLWKPNVSHVLLQNQWLGG
jgi:hypothetical protein